ncbi:MAG: D-alanine--D-alanine ligase, partial [Nitrospira sp.]|nr:D-alanine--D-alanine ligase [Nitrospira sp.]
MKRLRVLVLMHKDLVPPESLNGQSSEQAAWRTEYDVVSTLKKLGHEVQALGVKSDLEVIRTAVEGW